MFSLLSIYYNSSPPLTACKNTSIYFTMSLGTAIPRRDNMQKKVKGNHHKTQFIINPDIVFIRKSYSIISPLFQATKGQHAQHNAGDETYDTGMIGSMKYKKKHRSLIILFNSNYSEKAEGYFFTSKITKELHRRLQTRKNVLCVQTKK